MKSLSNNTMDKGLAHLLWRDDFQLFAQRCSKLATSPTSSMCFMKSASLAIPLPLTSTRLLYSGISSLFALLSLLARPRGAAEVYLPTPGISRARAAEAAAVREAVRDVCEVCVCSWEEERDDVRRKGSKCSLSLSNSSESGAESSERCSWARASFC